MSLSFFFNQIRRRIKKKKNKRTNKQSDGFINKNVRKNALPKRPNNRLARAHLSFRFALDREQVKHTNSGVKRSRATLGDDGELDEVVIVTTMLRPGGSSVIVVEARKLLNRGQTHQQVSAGFLKRGTYRQTPDDAPIVSLLLLC